MEREIVKGSFAKILQSEGESTAHSDGLGVGRTSRSVGVRHVVDMLVRWELTGKC